MTRPRFPKGHRLMELDTSDESCVAVCECEWSTITLGHLMRQKGAYAHAEHVCGIKMQKWVANDGEGPMPHAPRAEDYLSRTRFRTYRKVECR